MSQLQSQSTVILEPRKIEAVTVIIVFPCFCHEVIGLDVVIFVFDLYMPYQVHPQEKEMQKGKMGV